MNLSGYKNNIFPKSDLIIGYIKMAASDHAIIALFIYKQSHAWMQYRKS